MDRHTWAAIVYEATRRYRESVRNAIREDGHDDVAIKTLKLIASQVELFSVYLESVGRERLP